VFSRNALYKSTFYLLTYLLPQYVNFDNVGCGLRFSGRLCTTLYTLPCEIS